LEGEGVSTSSGRSTMSQSERHSRATGLSCIALAALRLGTVEKADGIVERIFGQLEPRLALPLLTAMPGEKCIRAAARAVGIDIWRMHPASAVTIDRLAWRDPRFPRDAGVWIALLRSRFDDPKGIDASYESPHYVLVLDVLGDEVIVADPHPWHEMRHTMTREIFETAWTAVRGPGKPRWAGCLSKRSE
jgi:hypothetical protein